MTESRQLPIHPPVRSHNHRDEKSKEMLYKYLQKGKRKKQGVQVKNVYYKT